MSIIANLFKNKIFLHDLPVALELAASFPIFIGITTPRVSSDKPESIKFGFLLLVLLLQHFILPSVNDFLQQDSMVSSVSVFCLLTNGPDSRSEMPDFGS